MSKSPESRSSILQLLKLSFGGSKTVELPLSCYGKLPLYRDFIRNALAGPEAQAFKQWLDRGFSRHWEAQDACREYRFGSHALVLTFPGTGRTVLAYVWGSADNEGLRRFPFAFFVSVPASRGSGPGPALDAAAQFARRAQGWQDDLDVFRDVETLLHAVRDRRVSLTLVDEESALERLREGLGGVTVREFAESLYGAAAPRLFPALLDWLRRLGGHGQDLPVAARLPGSPLLPAVHQAGLWAGLLRDERGRRPTPCNLLVPLQGDAGVGPVILGRDLRPEDVLVFHPEMPGYELAEDLRRTVPGLPGTDSTWLAENGGEPVSWLLGGDARHA